MSYRSDLIRRLRDLQAWPTISRPEMLNQLDAFAKEAFAKDTLEGRLAALLVFHHLTEEMVRVLLEDAHFFIQLAVFPAEIVLPTRDRTMFGRRLEDLQNTVDFPHKADLLTKCAEFNTLRVNVVHRLSEAPSLEALQQDLERVERLYEEVFTHFDGAHEHFAQSFGDFGQDITDDFQLTPEDS